MTEPKELIEARKKIINKLEYYFSEELGEGAALDIANEILNLKGDRWRLAVVDIPKMKKTSPLRYVIWQAEDDPQT